MSDYIEGKSRWWGWGDLDKAFDLESKGDLMPLLEEIFEEKLDEDFFEEPELGDFSLPKPSIDSGALKKLESIVGEENISSSTFDRVSRSMGKSFRDLLRFRLKEIPKPVDIVIYPRNESEILAVIEVCNENGIAVIPIGGGSSVVGGIEPKEGPGYSSFLSMDLRNMTKMGEIDGKSMIASAEAGIQGPDLEEELEKKGYTLGHFPESFLHSGLGGWVASRSAGRLSTAYGKIDDMVLSLRMATPSGIVATRNVPSTSAGPSVLELYMGSEGAFGVITNVSFRLREVPEERDYRAFLFRNFSAGSAAIKEMMQSQVVPEVVRLSDRTETMLANGMRSTTKKFKRKAEDAALSLLKLRGYSFKDGAFMLLGLEGTIEEVDTKRAEVISICKRMGGFHLGTSPGKLWYRSRYDNPHFRDRLMNYGVMTDTLETATTWDNVMHLYGEVRKAILSSIEETGKKGLVACHLSHCYRDGTSLYFIFMAPMVRGKEEGNWVSIKKAASDAIMENGGTITHHHGVGYEHAPWMEKEIGKEGIESLKAVKHVLDPKGIMNPGKLFV